MLSFSDEVFLIQLEHGVAYDMLPNHYGLTLPLGCHLVNNHLEPEVVHHKESRHQLDAEPIYMDARAG